MTPLVATDRLDHVHLNVTDRAAAVHWYGRVLGLRIFGQSDPPDAHPLFLATARGARHCVSLFVGKPAKGPNRNVAFHADAQAFAAFARQLPQPDVIGHKGQPLTTADTHDYGMAITFDFLDPDGNHIELVTYDHETTRNLLMDVE